MRLQTTQLKNFLSLDTRDHDDETLNFGVKRILLSAKLTLPLTLLVMGLFSSVAISIAMINFSIDVDLWKRILMVSSTLSVLGLVIAVIRLQKQLLKPLARLEATVAHVCQGETDEAVVSGDMGIFDGMAKNLGSINEELTDLYEDMDSRVSRQTTRLAQKTASLKILYDVAATVNQAKNLDDLLLRFLRVLKEMLNGKAATVRLCTTDKKMRLVGSIGLEDIVLTGQDMLPVQLCVCGTALTPGDILCKKDSTQCSLMNGRKMFGNDEIEVVSVPLEYHSEMLGNYSIFVDKAGITGREDIMELLATIGSHLGMAVAKQRSDADTHRLSIVKERSAFAHELHDSLAQTLASLRFQVRMLEDSLNKESVGNESKQDLERIRNGLDEAHTELRELLNNFRAPLDDRGLTHALQGVTERFGHETGIHTFFQHDCSVVDLTVSQEMQIVRIVQESLANTRKHANAQTVRVLLTYHQSKGYRILVEDDGIGFASADKDGKPGEHIGLNIMEERALQLGADFKIESEDGEGTRIELIFNPKNMTSDKEAIV